MKEVLRISCISVPGSVGKAARIHIPDQVAKLAEGGYDYVHVQIRMDLAVIIVGFVKGGDVAYKLKKDGSIVSRVAQDELGLKVGQRLYLELLEIDEKNKRAVFEGDLEWFQKKTNRFFD